MPYRDEQETAYLLSSSSVDSRQVRSGTVTPRLPQKGKLLPNWIELVCYYLPFLRWISTYKLSYLAGDVVAGVTVASFQIPVAMGYATSLAMVPTVCGLYGLVIPPVIYSLFGSVPQMVVGPEAPISLVVGQAVTSYLHSSSGHHVGNGDLTAAEISGLMSAGAGCVLLSAGILRFGYLDSVLSHALLRGFISAVGILMVIDQMPAELGIVDLMHEVTDHPSAIGKIAFLWKYCGSAHRLTTIVSGSSFFTALVLRTIKSTLSNRAKFFRLVPDILIVVAISTMVCAFFQLNEDGIDVVGDVQAGHPTVEFPITAGKLRDFKANFSGSFFAAVLGFFESSLVAKAFQARYNINLSANRELVALGLANLCGSCVCALPAFGGYGRSIINDSSGARTPLAGLILASVVFFVIKNLSSIFFYLPRCVLSSVISLIGLGLLKGIGSDIHFYWTIAGYEELLTIFLTLSATMLWSVQTGIAAGVGFSLVRVIHHATLPRIQILGRIPGTNTFRNADKEPEFLEPVDGCLIVKIPEPLTFANAGTLRTRLNRLERYGSMRVHPSHPRIINENNVHNLIIDLRGMTECDGGATKILAQLISDYVRRGITVLFVRMINDDKIRMRFERSGINECVQSQGRRQVYFDTIEQALMSIDDDNAQTRI